MSKKDLIRALLIVLGIISVTNHNSFAQIDYRFTQFLQNPVPVNPAFAGIDDFVDIKLGYRTQWAGFDNAPTSMYLSSNMALRITPGNNFKDRGVRLYEANAYNEKETDREFSYRKSDRSGLGFYMLQNQDGGFQNLAVFANYAYHIRITRELVWSIGAGFGFEYNKFDPSGISVLNPTNDPTYLSYLNGKNQKSNININVGTIVYHKQFYLGYSAINAGSFNISGDNTTYVKQVTQLTHTAQIGFRYKWKYGYLITPSILVKILPDNPVQVIGTLRARIHDKIWGGVQYTYLGAVGISVGAYITPNIGFNYAYDFPTSQINRATFGSHEVILAIKLKNKNYSRAYLW
jgi:type IX secretion system PorP/SprF family membrane protein